MSKTLRLATIIGARPQFIKCAPFSKRWRQRHREILIHTGQHYDRQMSDIFFQQLRIPKPDYHLGIGGGGHGVQTGRMLESLDLLLSKLRPDGVLVYGDTNSTLAGALAAAKLAVPVFHVEAGLRSYRKSMPEEINRKTVDHLATLLFAPTPKAVQNLRKEGLVKGVYQVGDIMLDAFRYFEPFAAKSGYRLPIRGPYALATVHRAESTATKAILLSICHAFDRLPLPVLWPVHPRTRKTLADFSISPGKNVTMIKPVGYLESLVLQKNAKVILTDSGGMQKEAYFQKIPCITLRTETEWVETVATGHNQLAGWQSHSIVRAVGRVGRSKTKKWPSLYGHGASSLAILHHIESYLSSRT